MTPSTEKLIVDTTVECERLRLALLGCLVAARQAKRDINEFSDVKGIATSEFDYIEREAFGALYGGKGLVE